MALELAPGVWNFDKSENFDEYMKALDVGFAKRVLGNQARPRQEISIVDDVWTSLPAPLYPRWKSNLRLENHLMKVLLMAGKSRQLALLMVQSCYRTRKEPLIRYLFEISQKTNLS
uniref:Cytosolic fatty-acid binding proteins domain-containing protein n=1 Tax=Arion vulgaris TaxID=1028688 RepID=A0A0B6YU47_9EUPU